MPTNTNIWKTMGFGCGACILLCMCAGIYLFHHLPDILQGSMATVTEQAFIAMVQALQLPAAEQEDVLIPVRDLVAQMRRGQVDLQKGLHIMRLLLDGPALAAVAARAFEIRYLEPSALKESAKKLARQNISRFTYGLITNQIPRSQYDQIQAIIAVVHTKADGSREIHYKERLSTSELQRCLQIMQSAADQAGIAPRTFKVDLAQAVREAIEKGLQEPAKHSGSGH